MKATIQERLNIFNTSATASKVTSISRLGTHNNALTAFVDKHFEQCAKDCRKALDVTSYPCPHRMRTLLLLGAASEDLDEARECLHKVDALWDAFRQLFPEGSNLEADKALSALGAEYNSGDRIE